MLESIPQVGRVELASGALSAIERLGKGEIYHLVVDANLPGEEIDSLVRWSKQNRPYTRCIVFAKSAVDLEQARSAGADAVLLRSSSAQQLAEALWPVDRENGVRA